MINDSRYNAILKKYGISNDTPIEQVRRILTLKFKEVHPDVNSNSDALEKSTEISNDRDYVISLIKKLKGNVSQQPQTQTPSNTDHKSSDNFKKQIDEFKIYLEGIKKEYQFIDSIVIYVNDILNYQLNNISDYRELQKIKKQLLSYVTYHKLMVVITYIKSQYEDERIDIISDKILKQMLELNEFDDKIYDLEIEFYDTAHPIMKMIDENIQNQISLFVKLLEGIKQYKNIQLNYFNFANYLFSLNDIKSNKKVKKIINDCYLDVKKGFIVFLNDELLKYEDDHKYCEYIQQILGDVYNSENLETLNYIMSKFNDDYHKFIGDRRQIIIKKAQKYLYDNSIPQVYVLQMYVNNIRTSSTEHDFEYWYSKINEVILTILKEKFQRRIQNDGVDPNLLFQYIRKIYQVKTENELNELIREYEVILPSNLLIRGKEEFLREIMYDRVNSILVNLYNEYCKKLSEIETIEQLQELRTQYQQERQKLLHLNDDNTSSFRK